MGEIFYQQQFENSSLQNFVDLNLGSLSTGIYLLEIAINEEQTIKKIVKE